MDKEACLNLISFHDYCAYFQLFNNGLYPINYMCNVTLNSYNAEIFFFPITCATEFFCFVFFFAKKSLFRHSSGFKKHYLAFSKKLILALGERYKSVYRYVLSLNMIKFINEPPF